MLKLRKPFPPSVIQRRSRRILRLLRTKVELRELGKILRCALNDGRRALNDGRRALNDGRRALNDGRCGLTGIVQPQPRAFLSIASFCFFSISSSASAKDLARVDGVGISEKTFVQALRSLGAQGAVIAEQTALREQFLAHLVNTELKAQAAKKQLLQQSEAYLVRLAQAEKQILAALLVEKMQKEQLTGSALNTYFEANRERFARSKVKVSQILLKNAEEAQRVLGLILKKKESFATSAKRYSVGEEAIRGGELGWIAKSSQSLALEKAAFTCPKGSVCTQVITSPAGFHLLKIDDVAYYQDRSFAALQSEIKQSRLRELEEELSSGLAQNANIYLDKKLLQTIRYP